MQHVLVITAHPDDESFMAGGVIAKLAQEGWGVDLLCATRGEEGDRGPFTGLAREKVGDMRQKELEKAGTVLGINSITFMGYKDGTLSERTPGDIEDVVYKKMEELVPDIVISNDTTGFTNHPDHVKLSYATTYAFQKYAAWIETRLENVESVAQVFPKLYYACIPSSVVNFALRKKIYPAEMFGKPWVGVADKNITTVVDVSDVTETKLKALHCHVTQTKDVDKFIQLPLMKNEYFMFRMHGTTEVFMGKLDHVASHL